MDQVYTCDTASETTEKSEKSSEREIECNRIFLNFTREFKHPARESCRIARVKDLFKYLSERQDLQEMKVSGWSDEGMHEEEEGEEEEEEDLDDEIGSYCHEKGTPREGGQRFAMSRDFWYRKLNTLKAQKLDEVALEAKDIPPGHDQLEVKCLKWLKEKKIYASQVHDKPEEVHREMDLFDKSVAKPIEKVLKKQFVNVYNNRKEFSKQGN